ncbi:MAG: 2-C-methyl-D-erythritol 2,4-cyclodiphosphate synthase [SAR202 cluster bacterium]|nr:2-C-methyl-D-erythritol 2,4-cyclodiphosphate synthase [SAR202 cluster bacterium]
MTTRTGIGFDVHPLTLGRPFVLGGITVPHEKGLAGHSDGDVLLHAIIDAVLGGARQGDIGRHFPSSDQRYKGIASTVMLQKAIELATTAGWKTTYVDATIVAERPRLAPVLDRIATAVAASMGLRPDEINLKAKTTDGLGFIGRGEGVAAMAVATLERI